MLPEFASGISAAVKMKGKCQPVATRFDERTEPRHPHFAYFLKGIERMFHTGQPSYPVERTLLTSGILDRALTSRVQDHQRLQTPELAISLSTGGTILTPRNPTCSPIRAALGIVDAVRRLAGCRAGKLAMQLAPSPTRLQGRRDARFIDFGGR